MPIVTTCACGFRFKAPDKLAGRKARCPKCNQVLQIPALEAEAAPFEEAAAPVEPAATPRATTPEMETREGPAALPPKEDVVPAGPGSDAPVAPASPPEETKPAEDAPKPEIPAEAAAPEAPAPEAPPPTASSPTTRRTGRFRKDLAEKGTAKTEKPAAKSEKPAPKATGPAAPNAIMEYLSFKRMITPSIVKLLFWLGEFLLVLSGLGSVVSAVIMMTARHGDVVGGLVLLVAGPVSTIIGMLLWRVFCESALLYFQVFDRLGEIRDLLAKQKEGSPAAVTAASPASAAAPAVPAVPSPEAAPAPAPEGSAAAVPATPDGAGSKAPSEPAPASE